MKLNTEKSLISESIPDTHPYFTQDSYFVPELDFLLHSYYIILHNNSDSLPPPVALYPPNNSGSILLHPRFHQLPLLFECCSATEALRPFLEIFTSVTSLGGGGA